MYSAHRAAVHPERADIENGRGQVARISQPVPSAHDVSPRQNAAGAREGQPSLDEAPQHSMAKELMEPPMIQTAASCAQLLANKLAPEEVAARKIQALIKKKFERTRRLDRSNLIERLELEEEMWLTLVLFVLYGIIFGLLLQSLFTEFDPVSQRGLHRSYERNFNLGDVSEITTVEELREFLKSLSQASRLMQIQSSEYFLDEAEQKILGGLIALDSPLSLLSGGLSARIDSPSFSISAWVKLGSSAGGYVLRKPLKPTGVHYALSCWGLFVGKSETRFDFGAHDYSEETVGQERVSVLSRDVSQLHMQTIVVTQTWIRFYHNAELVGARNLSRSVTDCSEERLEVGAAGMELGEVVFYPRALSPSQVREVFIGGATLDSLAAGKAPFEPEETPFDRLQSYAQGRFDDREQAHEDATTDAGIEQVLQRGVVSNIAARTAPAGLPLPEVPPEPGCVGEAWPPCRLIRGVNATLATDPHSGALFYDLIPAHNFPGMLPGGRLSVSPELRRHQYETASFPSSVGRSFSFSVWAQPLIPGSSTYLISKHPSPDSSARCWSFNVASSRVGLYTGATLQGQDLPHGLVYFPEGVGSEFGLVNGPLLRHIVLAVDADAEEVRAYMDGERIGATGYSHAELLDCSHGDGAYVAFLHRAPQSHDYVGDIQQLRLYPGVALSDAQVAAMHAGAEDAGSGGAIRECSFASEGLDSSFRDLMGHDCAWFDEARQTNAQVCVGEEVAAQCPIACAVDRECYQPASSAGDTDADSRVWERVMWIRPRNAGSSHAMCVARHVDTEAVLDRCRRRVPPTPPGVATGDDPNGIRATALEGLLNASDCEALAAAIDPLCSFAVPQMWTKTFEDGVTAGDDFTLSLWIKMLPNTQLDAAGQFRPVIQLFSSIAPSQPIITLHFFDRIFYAVLARHCGNAQNVGVGTTGTLDKDSWVHISVIWENQGGSNYKLAIVMNSLIKPELHTSGWCKAESGEFLQGISFSHEMLVSPIRVRRYAVPQKTLQKEFYALRPAMRLRTGPKQHDDVRLNEKITYVEKPYTASGFLLAPPLLLQDRVAKTEQCASTLGTSAIRSTWEYVTGGSHCSSPFQCSDDLMSSPLQIASCSQGEDAGTLFGRQRLQVAGSRRFAEFLSSITDNPVVVRDGRVFQTERFIDAQTRSTDVIMALVSPDEAIATIVDISATVGTQVSVSYSIRHIQSVEGSVLTQYKTNATWTLVVTSLLFLSCIMRVFQPHAPREYRLQAAADLVLALLVLVFVSLRWESNSALGPDLAAHVGEHGLGGEGGRGILGVPWAAEDVSYDDKLDRFSESLDGLSRRISAQQRLDLFGFLISVAILVRIIVVISVHPRVSLLVATVTTGIDDFVHFFLLLGILYMCFAVIALLRFAPKYDNFANFQVTLVTQFELMLGNLPDNFADDVLLSVFMLFFLIAVFFLMLNFLLAIIVDSYMRVKAEIERKETEQNVMADAGAALIVVTKRILQRWPSTYHIIQRLEEQRAKLSVGVENLALKDQSWSRQSRVRFLAHYARYDFLAKKPLPERIKNFDNAIDDLEKRIALLIKAEAPTALERTLKMSQHKNDAKKRRKSIESLASMEERLTP